MVRRIPCLAAVAVLVGPALWGQESTAEFLKRWRGKTSARAPLVLLLSQREEDGYGGTDPVLQRLRTSRDLTILRLEKKDAADLWRDRALPPGPHWFLFAREGPVLVEGNGIPRGEQVLDAIHANWGLTRSERLGGFLREHPDSGEALDLRLASAIRQANALGMALQKGKEPLDEKATELVFGECANTLTRLLELPDWWRSRELDLLGWIWFIPHAQVSTIRAVLARMRDALEEELCRNPHLQRGAPGMAELDPEILLNLWMSLSHELGDRDPLDLPRVSASPGRTWPGPQTTLRLAYSRDTDAARLEFLEALPEPTPPPSKAEWSSFCQNQGELQQTLMSTYGSLGMWPQAASALREERRWRGSKFDWRYPLFSLQFVLGNLPDEVPEEERLARIEARLPKELVDLAKSPPEPDPVQPPPAPPVRMVLWGSPSWAPAWAALLGHPALLPWAPDELRWEAATAEDLPILAAAGLKPPQWALRQGEAGILAHGSGAPRPVDVLPSLAQAGPSRLQVLDAFIRQNPGQLDARRDRFALLRPRMPQPALEAILAEDALAAWIPLDFGPEMTSVPDLWKARAARFLPEVEAALRRWPTDGSLWKVWLTWSAFSPRPASPRAFALGLEHPQPLGKWLLGLPAELHEAVAAECRKARSYNLMQDWFQPAADALASGVYGFRESLQGLPRKAVAAGLAEAAKGLASARR